MGSSATAVVLTTRWSGFERHVIVEKAVGDQIYGAILKATLLPPSLPQTEVVAVLPFWGNELEGHRREEQRRRERRDEEISVDLHGAPGARDARPEPVVEHGPAVRRRMAWAPRQRCRNVQQRR